MGNKINKLIFRLGYLVTIITFISLIILSQATQNSIQFEKYYLILEFIILSGIFLLFIIVSILLFKLFYQYKKKHTGSSLSVNILVRSLLLAFFPFILISFFSLKFLNSDFQSSFDSGIDEALNNSLKLSQKTLNIRGLQALKEVNNISNAISNLYYQDLLYQLEKIRKDLNIYELTIFDEKSFIQAFSSENTSKIIPSTPSNTDFLLSENNNGFFVLESIDEGYQIRVLTTVKRLQSPNYYLQAIYQIPNTMSQLANQVNRTITERDKFNYLKPKVNNSFTVVLVMVILLSTLLLVLSAVNLADYMAKPIRILLKRTKRISRGDFSNPIEINRQDDFGLLMSSFNQMSSSLATANKIAESSQLAIENERIYLATVIENITSAVITLNKNKELLVYNTYAEKLLECNLEPIIKKSLKDITIEFEQYKNFINQISFEDNDYNQEKEIEISINNKKKEFVTKLTLLPITDRLTGGFVIIFDSLTQYWQRQKEAAWEEVARRLAHEIKNPLTPIQLAAERINYKIGDHLEEKEKTILTRSTTVIINQVKSMKNMVDDFSAYAKPSHKKSKLDINKLLDDILDLYIDHFNRYTFIKELKAERSVIMGDTNLFRQCFHNILKNAMEAIEPSKKGLIKVETQNTDDFICIIIYDNGIGIKDNEKDIFEPYVTNKEKGTGLGLSIVKKAVTEHQGNIHIKNNDDNEGAVIEIRLPLLKNDKSTTI